MSRGKRFDDDNKKLNIKKVLAVIIAIAVIVMFVIVISKIISKPSTNSLDKVSSVWYYSVYTNNKWGVIDGSGKTIVEPTYDEMIIIPNNQKAVFICTTDTNYQTGEYKTKILNEKNQEIFKTYESVEAIENYDTVNNLWYENNVLKAKKDGKYGLIDFSGNEVLKCEYEDIYSLKGIKNSLITVKEQKLGLCDDTGNIIINNEYKQIKSLTQNYENGFIVINDNNKYGVINYNKKVALEDKYEDIKQVYGNNKYVVKEAGVWKLIDNEQNVILDAGFDDIKQINSDNITIVKNNKYGITTITKEVKVEPIYDELTYAFLDYYIAKKDNKYGIINSSNETKIEFKYTELTYKEDTDFIEGITDSVYSDMIDRNLEVKLTGIISEVNQEKGYMKVRVEEEYKYYNFKFEEKKNTDILTTNTLFLSKKDGKYGFVNKEGVVVVNYIYDDATEQNKFGYAAIKKDGLWGSIDNKGNVVINPTYNLDNNLKIDFISTWHIGEDINCNYYCNK